MLNLKTFLDEQKEWSERVFGPGNRTLGVIKHIRLELNEIEENPIDLLEWIDVVLLSLDGAWRAGYTSKQIIDALIEKSAINRARKYSSPGAQHEPVLHLK